jgi:hypothetical protein
MQQRMDLRGRGFFGESFRIFDQRFTRSMRAELAKLLDVTAHHAAAARPIERDFLTRLRIPQNAGRR